MVIVDEVQVFVLQQGKMNTLIVRGAVGVGKQYPVMIMATIFPKVERDRVAQA